MVRVNLINPKNLSDQHLVAEYREILMLLGYAKRYPGLENLPERYTLGKGHIRFFKDKLLYLQRRHDKIRKEMIARGFSPLLSANLSGFGRAMRRDWKPKKEDIELAKSRIVQRLRQKPHLHRHYGKKKPSKYLVSLVMKSDVQ